MRPLATKLTDRGRTHVAKGDAPDAGPGARILIWFLKRASPRLKERIFSSRFVFDAQWYHETYFDVRAAGLDPLDHFQTNGFTEGRAPNGWAGKYLGLLLPSAPEAAPSQIEVQAAQVEASGLFDADWYALTYDVEPASALMHFLTDGLADKTDPNPFFSSKGYFKHNPDVAAFGLNALVHFLEAGCVEGRRGFLPDRFTGRLDLHEDVWQAGLPSRASRLPAAEANPSA